MYDYLILDCETTTFAKGNPYSQRNKLCLIGIKDPTGKEYIFDIEYSDNAYYEQLQQIQELLYATTTLVLFNAKFDLCWLRRYNLDYSHCRIFDCQLADFIISGQTHTFPSLNGVSESYGLEQKLDEVKEQYWEKGIDTPDIPLDLLTKYLSQDLLVTEQVYGKQLQQLSSMPETIRKLIYLSNQDLLVLLEMEWNGLLINWDAIKKESIKTEAQINQLRKELNEYFTGTPSCCLDYNSGDCLSALLYGGTIVEEQRTVVGEYKTGVKTGQPRYRLNPVQHVLLRRFEPPANSNLKKEGFYATNEETLRSIKTSKEGRVILNKLLEMSKLEKLNGTYYLGLAKLHEEKDWEAGFIHGQFNQCVARTGRLSSSSPNLQNFPPEVDKHIRSRYG
jgi:DNA polymerase I-like protein with 3'-5' exonuclease and polymerase domains